MVTIRIIDIDSLIRQTLSDRSIHNIIPWVEFAIHRSLSFQTKHGDPSLSLQCFQRVDLIYYLTSIQVRFIIIWRGRTIHPDKILCLAVNTTYTFPVSQEIAVGRSGRPKQAVALGEIGDQWKESHRSPYEELLIGEGLGGYKDRLKRLPGARIDRSSGHGNGDEREGEEEVSFVPNALVRLYINFLSASLNIVIKAVLWSGITYPFLGKGVLRLVWQYPCGCTYHSEFPERHITIARAVFRDLCGSRCRCLLLRSTTVDTLQTNKKSTQELMRHLVVLLSQTLSVWRMIGALDQSYNKTGSAGDDDQHAGRQGQYNRGISPSPPGNLVRRQSNGANDDWFSCYSSGSGHNQSIQSLPSPPEQPRCPPPRWFIVCKNIGNRAWKPAHISSHSLSHDTELVEALDKHWRKVNGIYGSCFGWIRVNRPLVRRVNIITDDYENGQEVAHPMERWGPGPDVDDAMNWDPIPPTERPPDADSWELHMDYLINHRTKRLFWKGTELFCWVISHTKSFLNRLLTSILLCASGIAKRVGFPGHNITDGLSGLEEIVVDNHPGHAHTMSHRILTGLSKRQNIKLRARPNECTFGWAILLRTSVRPPPSMVLLSFILLFVFSIGTIVTCFILLPTAGWDVFSFTGAPTLVVAVVTLLYATLASLA